MSKAKKNIKLPQYKKGGRFGEHAGNVGATLLDITASTVGMDNVADSLYTGKSADKYKAAGDFTGSLTKAAAPMVMNAFIPGSGAIVSAGQGVLGQVDNAVMANNVPIDPETGKPYKQTMAAGIGKSLGNLGGSIAPMLMKAPYGGSITQVDGPSHAQGGVKIQSPNGFYEVEKQEVINSKPGEDRILSDRLKNPATKKTFAEDFKTYEKLGKIINNPKLSDKLKADAKVKQEQAFNDLYETQEQLKLSKLNKYAKRIGLANTEQFPNGGSKYPIIDPNKAYDGLTFSPSGGKVHLSPEVAKQAGLTYKSGNWNDPTSLMFTKDGKDYSYATDNTTKNAYYVAKTPRVASFETPVDTEKKIAKVEQPWIPVSTTMIDGKQAGTFRKGNARGEEANMRYYFDSAQGYVPIKAYGGSMKKYDDGGIVVPESQKAPEEYIDNAMDPNDPRLIAFNQSLLSGLGNSKSKLDPNWGQIATQFGVGLASNIGNLYDLKRASEVEDTKYNRVRAEQLDPTATLQYNKMMNRKLAEDIKNSSVGNSSTYLQSRKDAAINQALTDARIRESFENQNANLRTNAQMYNAQVGDREFDANAANRATSRNIKSSAYSNIGQNVMGQRKDFLMSKNDQDRINILGQYYNDPEFQKMLSSYQKSKGFK